MMHPINIDITTCIIDESSLITIENDFLHSNIEQPTRVDRIMCFYLFILI